MLLISSSSQDTFVAQYILCNFIYPMPYLDNEATGQVFDKAMLKKQAAY